MDWIAFRMRIGLDAVYLNASIAWFSFKFVIILSCLSRNVENNQFAGPIPPKLLSIPAFRWKSYKIKDFMSFSSLCLNGTISWIRKCENEYGKSKSWNFIWSLLIS